MTGPQLVFIGGMFLSLCIYLKRRFDPDNTAFDLGDGCWPKPIITNYFRFCVYMNVKR